MQQLKKRIDPFPVKKGSPSKDMVDRFEAEGKSLFQLLNDLDFLDGEEGEDVAKKQQWIMEAVKNKADSYKYILDRYKFEIQRADELAKEFQARKESLVRAQKRIKKIALFVLGEEQRKHNTKHIMGHLFRMQKTRTKGTINMSREPTALDSVKLREFIRTKYSWDKDKIGSAINNNQDLQALGSIDENYSVRFYARKDI